MGGFLTHGGLQVVKIQFFESVENKKSLAKTMEYNYIEAVG